jgi:hypothetical protein
LWQRARCLPTPPPGARQSVGRRRALARGHLVVDPLVGLLHSVFETDRVREPPFVGPSPPPQAYALPACWPRPRSSRETDSYATRPGRIPPRSFRTRRGTPPLRPASSGALSAADRRCSAPRPPLEVGELRLEVLMVARRRQVPGPWAAGLTAALVAARTPGSMFKWGKPEGNVHQVRNPIIQASSLLSVTSQWLSWDQGTRQSLSNLVCFFAKRSNR